MSNIRRLLLIILIAVMAIVTVSAQDESEEFVESIRPASLQLSEDGGIALLTERHSEPIEDSGNSYEISYQISVDGELVWDGGLDELVYDFDVNESLVVFQRWLSDASELVAFNWKTEEEIILAEAPEHYGNVFANAIMERDTNIILATYSYLLEQGADWISTYRVYNYSGEVLYDFPLEFSMRDIRNIGVGQVEIDLYNDPNTYLIDLETGEIVYEGSRMEYESPFYGDFSTLLEGFTSDITGCKIDRSTGDCIPGTEYEQTGIQQYATLRSSNYNCAYQVQVCVAWGTSSQFSYVGVNYMFFGIELTTEGDMDYHMPLGSIGENSFRSELGLSLYYDNSDSFVLTEEGIVYIIFYNAIFSSDITRVFFGEPGESVPVDEVTERLMGDLYIPNVDVDA
jgi:hypothetical protein